MKQLHPRAAGPLGLFLILILALGLRLPGLGSSSFWNDESYVALFAVSPTPLEHLVTVEHSPPLYFAFIRAWTSVIGTTEFSLRFPSVLAGLAAIAAAYALGRLLVSRRVGLIAALLVCSSAHLATHAREARGYIFLVAPFLVALAGAARRSEGPSRAASAALIVAGTCVVFLHYAAIPFVGIVALTPLLVLPKGERRGYLKVLAAWLLVGTLISLPWLPHFSRQLGSDSFFAGTAPPPLVIGFKDGLHFLARFLVWTIAYNIPVAVYHALFTLFAAGMSIALGVGVVTGVRSPAPRMRTATIAIALCFGLAGVLVMRGVAREMVYLLFLEASLLVLVAVVLGKAGRTGLVLSVALIALGILGIQEMRSNRFHLEDRLERVEWREVATLLASEVGPGEIVVAPSGWASSLGWYLRDAPHIELFQFTRPDPYFKRSAHALRLTPSSYQKRLRVLQGADSGVWWVEHRVELEDPSGELKRALELAARASEIRRETPPRVIHYRLR